MTLSESIAGYTMTDQIRLLVQQTPLLLIAGVVSAGKDTTVKQLLKDDYYYNIISHTTRLPRKNHGILEINHRDYHFISLSEATKMVQDRSFIETKFVHGNVYGTSAEELQKANDSGKIAMTDIDIEGVIEYLQVKPDTHAVFLLPPSVDTWLKRLETRYGDVTKHSEDITIRFQTAYHEIIKVRDDPRFILVVNDDLKTTVKRIQSIVDGVENISSDYARAVTDHLLDFLKTRI